MSNINEIKNINFLLTIILSFLINTLIVTLMILTFYKGINIINDFLTLLQEYKYTYDYTNV